MDFRTEHERILFVGLNTIDLQFIVNEYPAANTKVKAKHNEIYVGGPATNAAIACAYLGAKTDLFSPVGKHSLTDFIADDLNKHGVNLIDPIPEHKCKPVFASIITTDHNGERTIFSYHPEQPEDEHYIPDIDFRNYNMALFDGFHPAYALPIAKMCREAGITNVLDGGSWKPGLDQLLDYIDIAICSNDFSVPDGNTPEFVFQHLHQRGIDDIAITRGEHSILLSRKEVRSELEIETVDAVDTLGAGDIFHGAFCFYYSLSSHFEQALQQAAAVAGKSCESLGTRQWMSDKL